VVCLVAGAVGVLSLVLATPAATAGGTSGWNIVAGASTPSSQNDLVLGSTCADAWTCWAVGGSSPSLQGNFKPGAMVEQWNGTAWTGGPDVVPPGTQASLLWSVTCVDSADCWAVGAQEPNSAQSPNILVERWNGISWAVVPTPTVGGYLLSVACAGSSDCWAVGTAIDGKQNPSNGIVLHWDGSAWSQVSPPAPAQPYDLFASVTCTSSSDCWAVGEAGPNQIQFGLLPGVLPNMAGGQALIEHWNGVAWSIVPAAPVAAGPGQILSSVSCTGPANCWTVGTTVDDNGNPSTPLAERWNGSAWSVVPATAPTTPGDILTSIDCVDANDCWASGDTEAISNQNNNSSPTPFLESWNGTTWSIDPSPNVLAFGYLNAVSCVRGSGCFATGISLINLNNNQSTLQALIEQLQFPPAANQGLMMVGSDGGVFSFGTAQFHGSAGGARLNAPVVGVASTPDGGGYWLVGADGGVFAFGDATFYGSTGGMTLNKPIVGMASTPDGGGYWLVASDGGVFAFGDATFYGSTGAMTLNKPIVGMASTPDGGGYWLVASDGGVFSLGDATYDGSVPGQGIVQHAPVEGLVPTPDGGGYWEVGQDGALYSYGDATFLGSLVGFPLAAPIVGAAATP
jgi:hypothetical protein